MKETATCKVYLDAPQSPTGAILAVQGSVRRYLRTRVEMEFPVYVHESVPRRAGWWSKLLVLDTKSKHTCLRLRPPVTGPEPCAPPWVLGAPPLRSRAPVVGRRLPGAGCPYFGLTQADMVALVDGLTVLYASPLAERGSDGRWPLSFSLELRRP